MKDSKARFNWGARALEALKKCNSKGFIQYDGTSYCLEAPTEKMQDEDYKFIKEFGSDALQRGIGKLIENKIAINSGDSSNRSSTDTAVSNKSEISFDSMS
jgi:hypothetical protein